MLAVRLRATQRPSHERRSCRLPEAFGEQLANRPFQGIGFAEIAVGKRRKVVEVE